MAKIELFQMDRPIWQGFHEQSLSIAIFLNSELRKVCNLSFVLLRVPKTLY